MTSAISDIAGEYIRMARKKRGWSVRELAERCAETGAPHLTEPMIENIEHGRRRDGLRVRKITVDEVFDLAGALGCRPRDLLPGIDDPDGGLIQVTTEEFQMLNSVFSQVLMLCRPPAEPTPSQSPTPR